MIKNLIITMFVYYLVSKYSCVKVLKLTGKLFVFSKGFQFNSVVKYLNIYKFRVSKVLCWILLHKKYPKPKNLKKKV